MRTETTNPDTLSDSWLRIAVAEHVFGYHVERIKPDWYSHEVFCFYDPAFAPDMTYSWDENGCNARMYRNGLNPSAGTAPPLPSYESEDSEGAEYQVVNRMIELGYHFRLYGFNVTHREKASTREFEAEFLPTGSNHEERYIAKGEWPQLAICRAALKASLGSLKPKKG